MMGEIWLFVVAVCYQGAGCTIYETQPFPLRSDCRAYKSVFMDHARGWPHDGLVGKCIPVTTEKPLWWDDFYRTYHPEETPPG